jgi:hypothetical protein
MNITNIHPTKSAEESGPQTSPPPLIPDLLTKIQEKTEDYNDVTAYALCLASTWAYSDAYTLSEAMRRVGFECYVHSIELSNDALFVRTTATLIQHVSGKVAFLCFRGTEPKNIINWMTDVSVETERLSSWGRVHGGFYHELMPIWVYLTCRIEQAILGFPVTDNTEAGLSVSVPRCRTEADLPTIPHGMGKLEELYITGHSLGGALAALSAAMIHASGRCGAIKDKLRGVYTFGQPMIGDNELTARCEKEFGNILYRHIYDRDIVPRFPPRITGTFRSFGQEYTSGPDGWSHRTQLINQTVTGIASSIVGILAWVTQQIPLAGWIRLPFSWGDHSPMNYLRTSRRSLPFYD